MTDKLVVPLRTRTTSGVGPPKLNEFSKPDNLFGTIRNYIPHN